jgi:superfamily II RNA helicase
MRAMLLANGERLSDDDALIRFTDYVSEQGLTLYPAQEEALLELLSSKHVILSTPTGSGKSLVATFLHFLALARGETSVYTCPIKALVNEKFFALCEVFGADRVGMSTGDASINADAPILCCTAEILMNRALSNSGVLPDAVIMDEFHYYADKERGVAWQVPLLLLEKTQFLLMSATLGDTSLIESSVSALTHREVARIHSGERPVPLDFSYSETPLHETIESLIAADRAPIYLVNFSQRAAAEQAQNLMSTDFSTKDEKRALKDQLIAMDATFATPFGKDLQKLVTHGIGLHHAGLLPRYRLMVERLAQKGALKVISGTDTLGVGVNVPIRTVLFTALSKYNGEKTAVLSVRDFLQVAGRAGRKGFDDRGTVVAQAPEHVIENIKLEQKKQAGKKVVKRLPPEKGYAHWDRSTFEKLQSKPPEPLESRFQVTLGMILQLLQAETETNARDNPGPRGYARLVQLIQRVQEPASRIRIHLRAAAQAARRLRAAGLIQLVRGNSYLAPHIKISDDLQRDFSLNHTLGLWLLDTLPEVNLVSDTYALDILTLVEAILEEPVPVLRAQRDKAKGIKIHELKAQGMEYAERMEELDKVEHPKPLRDFIYSSFNIFADKHPWVGQESVRPKSVAREMYENLASFNEYVRDYSLQRSEGTLLRYLGDVYRALNQSVPERFRDERLEDVLAYLKTTVRSVDSSLLDEWEALRDPDASALEKARRLRELQEGQTLRKRDVDERTELLRDPKKLAARARTEMHRLLLALVRKDFAGAAESLKAAPEDQAWTPEELEAEVAPAITGLGAIDVTPRARRPDRTVIFPDGEKVFRVSQKLLAPQKAQTMEEQAAATDAEKMVGESVEADEWVIEAKLDLSEPVSDGARLLELIRIGT